MRIPFITEPGDTGSMRRVLETPTRPAMPNGAGVPVMFSLLDEHGDAVASQAGVIYKGRRRGEEGQWIVEPGWVEFSIPHAATAVSISVIHDGIAIAMPMTRAVLYGGELYRVNLKNVPVATRIQEAAS